MFCRQSIDLNVGRVIKERYIVGSRLGIGSFSTVFKITDNKNSHLDLVMKISRKPDCDEKYKAEIDALTQCRGHPTFPQLYDNFFSGKYSCIFMTFSGEPIIDVLMRSKQFNCKNILRIAYSMIKALNYLHEHGFVHKDLNDHNVMIQKNSEGIVGIRVIDFGNSSEARPWKKENFCSYFSSLFVVEGKSYQEIDDVVSCVYILATLTGVDPFKGKDGLLNGKKRFHQEASGFFAPENQWIFHLFNSVIAQRDKDSIDMKATFGAFETWIPGCNPSSSISYKLVDGNVKLD